MPSLELFKGLGLGLYKTKNSQVLRFHLTFINVNETSDEYDTLLNQY